MDRPCCRGVVRSKDDLKGTKVATASTQVYLATPSTPNKLGIVIINDIFGFDIPNTLYVADHYAAHGFLTAVPDVFRGDSWPATEFEISEPLSGGFSSLLVVVTVFSAFLRWSARTRCRRQMGSLVGQVWL
eukprot:m.80254 g.80254  ORF g.80254 m.80254 type:complete len:131 (-) comp50686_c0_seq1:507-899(-)